SGIAGHASTGHPGRRGAAKAAGRRAYPGYAGHHGQCGRHDRNGRSNDTRRGGGLSYQTAGRQRLSRHSRSLRRQWKDLTMARQHRSARILVVDDEQANLDLLADCLADEDYSNVTCISDSRQTIAAYESIQPDLILLDLHMPGIDGFEILRLLGERIPEEEYLPILVLTADVTEVTKERALSGGAKDFLT